MAIELSDEMREALASALADRAPVVVAYTDAEGQPHLSFRGTTQVFSDEQLAFWVRDPNGGILRALPAKLALLYRNAETRLSWQFLGRAHASTDEAARTAIYDASPEFERNMDPERRGVAVIVDVDVVIARGQAIMQRAD